MKMDNLLILVMRTVSLLLNMMRVCMGKVNFLLQTFIRIQITTLVERIYIMKATEAGISGCLT